MDRRDFLRKSAAFLLGSFFGFHGLSRAFAFDNHLPHSNQLPRIAMIIDDIGLTLSAARQFLQFGVPITFAILPRLAKSEEAALEIHAQGHQIMLHQPMEPLNGDLDPGPGALYVGDEVSRIVSVLAENIAQVPFAEGVNNHMGSRFTASGKEVHEALCVVKEKGLFFVDSLTSNRSKAYKTARELHMPAAYRNIFLDNHLESEYILRQLRRLKNIALNYGHAIGIGHPFPETARAIGLFLKDMEDSGISLVHASDLVLTA
ncbi:MAG: divergent polysaccharide deacetylase family protein [Proteobacteria bacterium]|nr:divergent polysaccharide deacetylase family protein [Pseudomonadota bacterium]